jgi:hypothetical protein
MKFVVMLTAQRDCVIVTILQGGSPPMTHRAEMVSIRYGVLANAAAQIPGCLHALLGTKSVSLPHE